MNNTNTGGPAFPCDRIATADGRCITSDGMTLRDYFATAAMQGLIARESAAAFNFEACPNDPWRVALWAYDVADQMLKARDA